MYELSTCKAASMTLAQHLWFANVFRYCWHSDSRAMILYRLGLMGPLLAAVVTAHSYHGNGVGSVADLFASMRHWDVCCQADVSFNGTPEIGAASQAMCSCIRCPWQYNSAWNAHFGSPQQVGPGPWLDALCTMPLINLTVMTLGGEVPRPLFRIPPGRSLAGLLASQVHTQAVLACISAVTHYAVNMALYPLGGLFMPSRQFRASKCATAVAEWEDWAIG